MKKHYCLLMFLLSLLVIVSMLYWLPSYGVFLAVSIIALLVFSAGVGIFMVALTALEKAGTSIARLLRRGWNAAQPHSSLHS